MFCLPACALQQLASAEKGAPAGSDAQDAVAPSFAASADVATSKAAATALPDSDDEAEEDSTESTEASSTADESSREAIEPASASESSVQQPKLDNMAETASKAAATALPGSDSDADEELESQASASVPAVPAQGAQPGFGRPAWGALSSQAAESGAPPRRPLGRLDSLSASETDSTEVQSHPGSARQPRLQPAQEQKPAASHWLGSFGQPGAPPFGQALSASGAPAVPQAFSPAFGMSRQRSGALPEAAFGQPAPARQPSGSLPLFPSLVPRPGQVSLLSAVFSCMLRQSAAAKSGYLLAIRCDAPSQLYLNQYQYNMCVQAPQVPRLSAAQQQIARAREREEAQKSSKPAAAGAPKAPSPAPQRSLAADGSPKTIALQKSAQPLPPAEPSPPKAQLQGTAGHVQFNSKRLSMLDADDVIKTMFVLVPCKHS